MILHGDEMTEIELKWEMKKWKLLRDKEMEMEMITEAVRR